MPDPSTWLLQQERQKPKGKTISLNSFPAGDAWQCDHSDPQGAKPNWADEVEDTYDSYDGGRREAKNTNVVLPTAPKAARGIDDLSQKLPTSPPFNVYLSNLPYDVEEDELEDFFAGLKIVSMRIPREDRMGEEPRVKGFGYVEFEDQESLIEALEKPDCTLKGRRIRIEVATNSDNDRRRGRMDMNRPDRPEAPTGDWRSFGRQEPEGGPERRYNRDGGGGGGRDFNRDENRSGGMWRDGGERPSFRDRDGDRDRPSFRDRDGDRDRGGFSREPREDKPITRDAPPITRDGPSRYDSGERRGFGARRDRDDRPFERSDRRPDDRYMDRGERNGGVRRDEEGGEPRTRPKLNLAPRSVPVAAEPAAESAPIAKEGEEEGKETERVAEKAEPKVPAASIFGSAKPVDTTAREREIEERLAKVEVDSDRRRDEGRRRSPDRRRRGGDSPDRGESPSRRRSPEIRRGGGSPDRQRQRGDDRRPIRHDRDEKPLDRRDRNSSRDNQEKRPPREYTERDMPKIKTPEPLNIVGENKFAYLNDEGEDDEDEE
ncbi:eukaryotic translation initiation factor 4B-like [Atheta coriaria]|uniref:eukaryotic translation initiation factor 4B-like n=1 Tax=Dalotia coriaria TaxID=877792 RepID=UPI0031F37B0B